MKKIFILGASGSIGENALSVIDSNKENFELIGISANSNVEKVNKLIKKYLSLMHISEPTRPY